MKAERVRKKTWLRAVKRMRAKRRNKRGRHSYWSLRGHMALHFCEPDIPIDKSAWGDGPWQADPDWQRWQHSSGLDCLAMRSPLTGAFCGYVGIPSGHPFWRKPYDDIPVEVHGGLTFSEQLGARYWSGFDCAHHLDRMPAVEAQLARVGFSRDRDRSWDPFPEIYRDLAFVTAETERLAEQVSAAQ